MYGQARTAKNIYVHNNGASYNESVTLHVACRRTVIFCIFFRFWESYCALVLTEKATSEQEDANWTLESDK